MAAVELPDPTADLHWSAFRGAIQDIFEANALKHPDRYDALTSHAITIVLSDNRFTGFRKSADSLATGYVSLRHHPQHHHEEHLHTAK